MATACSISLVGFLICCTAAAVTIAAAPPPPDRAGDVANGPCCVLPFCVNSRRCYQTISCGHLCAEESLKKEFVPTPGYKIRVSYFKRDCRLEGCNEMHFECNKCPNPSDSDFSIHRVALRCRDCYYK
ncbi:unnamed protein product [Phyllotreta striolata]|uniref:Uncharacterized protein n=1 Tax=Phyllotreta striolata TaxID=444603 RepID=A0A9N9TDR5_PHYSR|nr:unnamed protein product [Phyllotreta striolata]